MEEPQKPLNPAPGRSEASDARNIGSLARKLSSEISEPLKHGKLGTSENLKPLKAPKIEKLETSEPLKARNLENSEAKLGTLEARNLLGSSEEPKLIAYSSIL